MAQIEWETQPVYKGPKRKAQQVKQDYKERGYYTRLLNKVTHCEVYVGTAKDYNWEKRT